MPLPSTVRVTNLENGRQVTLRVNDRGPFVGGRIIDISRRGAQLLGFYRKGTAKVRVEFVELAPLNVVAKKDNATPRRRMDAAEMAAVPSEPVAVREEISSQYLDAPMAESAAGGTGGDRLASASATSAASAAEPANGTTLSGMFVQVGAFAERANAVRLARQLSSLAPSVIAAANVDGRTLYRVRLGPLADMAEADRLLARTVAAGHGDARVIVAR
jgi:rare lipoprotein A